MKALERLKEILKERILVIDGAMGTMIQKYKLSEEDFRGERFKDHPKNLRGNNDIISITKPEIVKEIHRKYILAGADIIETNTFNATRISQSEYGLEDKAFEINLVSARLAREVAEEMSRKMGKEIFVAGAIGPTTKSASVPSVEDPSQRSITFDELHKAYYEQIMGLHKGGVHILLIETQFDTINTKAAIFAAKKYFEDVGVELPIMISTTIDQSGRNLSGQDVLAFLISVSHAEPLAVGINCSLGPKEMYPHLKYLSDKSPYFLIVYPNAGLPNEFGEYDLTPERFLSSVKIFLEEELINIVGGCCGTTPEHIKLLAEEVKMYKPRKPKPKNYYLKIAGLSPFILTPEVRFLNIGERTNVAGSKKFKNAILNGNFDEALKIAREEIENGAVAIDVCMDEPMIDQVKTMEKFIRLCMADPQIAKAPISIDSSRWDVIEVGLKNIIGKPIVNSLSLKDGEDIFRERAKFVKMMGAALIVMAFDEKGQAETYERKIEICKRAYEILKEIGFPEEDIIFDVNVLPVGIGTEESKRYAIDFIKAVKWIKENLPNVKTSGGISNLSFAFRGNEKVRRALNSVFLYHAIKAGLDMAILNPASIDIYEEIEKDLRELVEDVILMRDGNIEKLIEYAKKDGKEKLERKEEEKEWRKGDVEERLKYALINGIEDFLEEDLKEALGKKKAFEIIEEPLMEGMKIVGDLFGDGKMFLPQVVKSARVMKKAVNFLTPYMEEDMKKGMEKGKRGKVILATVKGDVHDIGKGIVGVVLSCNGYEVIDLGISVPAEKILEVAEKENVSAIGLSGLITPSLDEMVFVAREMEKRKMKIPLLIGGATTSKVHTAVKIDPEYQGPVAYVPDASQVIKILSSLLENPQKIKEYEEIRNKFHKRKAENILDLKTARERKFKLDWENVKIVKPKFLGRRTFVDYPLEEIARFIDWKPFFKIWKSDEKEREKIKEDAERLLQIIIKERWVSARGVIGFYPAKSVGDDVEIYESEEDLEKGKKLATLFFFRQQIPTQEGYTLSIADFISPKMDYIGLFVLSSSIGFEKFEEKFKKEGDDYSLLLMKSLLDRLAEAFAELMHFKVRKEFWGYAPAENLSYEEIIAEKYQGIRPAHGYPSMPDHSEKITLFKILKPEEVGIKLTEGFSIYPPSSVCGIYIQHKEAKYFGIGKITMEQVEDYAKRKGIPIEEAKKWVWANILF